MRRSGSCWSAWPVRASSPRLLSDTASPAPSFCAWRRTLRAERSEAAPGFVPAVIAPEPPTAATPQTSSHCAQPGDDRIEILLSRGRRIIVGSGVDAAALSRILDVLERR